jgi:hypothetical protein
MPNEGLDSAATATDDATRAICGRTSTCGRRTAQVADPHIISFVETDQSRVLNSCEAVQLTAILQYLLQHLYCSISCNSTLQL